MFLFFACFTSSVIFGVDFGSDNIKLGIALPGRIEVALNQQSKRYTPSYFSIYNMSNKQKTQVPAHWEKKQIRDLEWNFAYEAQTHNRRFPQNVVKGMPKLLENSHGLTGREQAALILKNLISTSADQKFNFEQSTLMFAVEPWLSRKERYALKEAVQIGESNIAGITDSPTAAATTYALERQGFYANKSKIVAFLDLGQSHTWISIFNFSSNGTKLAAEQLSVASNMSLGGFLVDEKVADLFMQKFAEQNNLKPPFSERVKQRFLDEARRSKERLTISDKTDAAIEDVIDDYCFNYVFTREEFNSLLSDVAGSLSALLDESLAKANMSKDLLDSIELLGGTTRVPFINETIRNWSGMEKLNRTMNSDEAIALGAGYVGASTSSSFIIQKVNMSSFALCNVSFYDEKGNNYSLFTEKNRLTDTAIVNFSIATLPKKITIHVEGEGDFETFAVKIPDTIPSGEISQDDKVSLEFGFDEITIPVLKKATVVFGSKLNVEATGKASWMITNNQLWSGIGIIHKMQNVLKKRVDLMKLMNEHESLIYKIQDRLDCDYEFLEVLTEEEKQNITEEVRIHQEWSSNETEKKTKKILRSKLRELNALTEDPDLRVSEHQKRPEAIKELNKSIINVKKEIKSIKKYRKWITEENLTVLREVLNSTIEWFHDKLKIINQENITSNPVVLASDFNRRRNALEDRLDRVKEIPKPKPVINKTALNASKTNHSSVENGEFVNGTNTNINATHVNATQKQQNTTKPKNNTKNAKKNNKNAKKNNAKKNNTKNTKKNNAKNAAKNTTAKADANTNVKKEAKKSPVGEEL